jgi:D-alanyl-D-alanine carboxypeptidase
MNKKKLLLFIVILIAASLFISCKKNETNPDPDIEKVRVAIEPSRLSLEQRLGKTVPSISVLIHTPSKTVFASAASSTENTLTADTYFRFASNTKTFTATAIVKMQQDGWLDIHNKITDLIPGSVIPYISTDTSWNIPYKNQISIEQLLQHTAGIYDIVNDPVPGCNGNPYERFIMDKDPTHQFSAAELVGQVARYQLSYFVPGTAFGYTNTGYSMLGEIIARVYSFHSGTAKGYSDYLYDYICGPNTANPLPITFPYLASDINLPSPYVKGNLYLDSISGPQLFAGANMSGAVAEGNGVTTFRGLDTFVRSLMKGQNVLNAASVQLLQSDVSSSNPSYALGCVYVPNLGYGHNGTSQCGYSSVMVYDPATDVSVIVMMPLADGSSAERASYCQQAVYFAAFDVRAALGYPGRP